MSTSRLQTKLYRDLVANKWQFAAVAFVVLLGVAMFVAGLMSYHNLFESYHLSYSRLRFADFWIAFDRAPEDVVRRIARVPGTATVEGRVNVEYPLQWYGRTDRGVVGRFIGLPTRRRPALNDLRIVEGRYFTPQAKREALLEASFARNWNLKPGDVLTVDVEGSMEDFRIVGLAQSPEYILAVRSEQYGMPTPSTFGVVFLPEEQAQESFDLSGQITEICGKVRAASSQPQGSNRPSPVTSPKGNGVRAVVDRVHAVLKPYGADEPVLQENQASNKLLRMDLQSVQQLALIFPSLFLTAAAMTIYVLMTRVVHSQRPYIGFLRASGFTQRAVVVHYLSFSLIAGVVGGLLGIGFGCYLAYLMAKVYVTTLNVPYLATRMRWDAAATGMGISVLTCLGAGFAPAWSGGMIPPAVAMRDETPVAQRASAKGRKRPAFGRTLPAFAAFPYVLRVPLRNLLRSRRRTFSTALGIASGISLVLVSAMFLDAIDYSIVSYFDRMQKYDALVEFLPSQTADMVYHLSRRPGVRIAEPGLSLPVELERNGRKFSTVLLGLPQKGRLYHVLDATGKPTCLHDDSLRVGNLIRERLKLETGDLVRVRYAFSSKDVRAEATLRVGPPIEQPATTLVYASIETVQRLFGPDLDLPNRPVDGIALAVDPRYMEAMRRYLHSLPQAAAVEITADTRAELDRMMQFNYIFITVMLLFGAGLAFAIVFNTLSINVLERTREIAAMRTLGFRHSQVSLMTTIENLLMAVLGLVFGLPLGRLLCLWLVRTYQSETVALQAIIYPRTYFLTITGMLLLVVFAQMPSLRGVRGLDLAKATKERTG